MIGNTNKAKTEIESISLRNSTVEVIPAKGWRELAPQGRKSMSYHISGMTTAPEVGDVFINARFPVAFDDDGNPLDLCGGVDFAADWRAKSSTALDSARLRYGPDNKPVIDPGGEIIYDEAPILQSDGAEFDLFYGTMFLVVQVPHRRIVLGGVKLTPTERTVTTKANDGSEKEVPVFTAEFETLTVEKIAVSNGAALNRRSFKKVTAGTAREQAARADAKASAADSDELPA